MRVDARADEHGVRPAARPSTHSASVVDVAEVRSERAVPDGRRAFVLDGAASTTQPPMPSSRSPEITRRPSGASRTRDPRRREIVVTTAAVIAAMIRTRGRRGSAWPSHAVDATPWPRRCKRPRAGAPESRARADRLPRPSAPGRAATRRPSAYFTPGNAERYRTAAEEHGHRRAGASPSTSTASPPRSTSGSTRSGASGRATTSTPTAASCARRPTSSWASRPTSSPGREDRMANLLERRDWDFVVGSVHFLRDRSLDTEDYSVWGAGESAEKVWRRYFETVAESALSGLYDIVAHPDLVKVWGDRAPRPERDLRYFYEPAVEAFAEAGVAVEVSTAGLRKPVGEIYPARPYLEMVLDAGCPIALSSDAHVPSQLGFALRAGAGAARASSACGSWPCSRAGSGGWSRSGEPDRHRDRLARVRAGPPARSSAASRSRTTRGWPGHSDADVLAHAIADALLGAAGLGDIGQHFPDTDERWRDADSMELLRAVPAMVGRDRARRRDGDDGAPKLAPHRDAIRASLEAALGCTRQRQGDHRRGDGLRRPRRGRRGAGGGDAGRLESARETSPPDPPAGPRRTRVRDARPGEAEEAGRQRRHLLQGRRADQARDGRSTRRARPRGARSWTTAR